jgi:membrane-bound lytic murein transglycosylase B
MKKLCYLFLFASLSFSPGALTAGEKSFRIWLDQFRGEAVEQGISAETVNEAFANVDYNADIIEADRNQAEFTITYTDYYSNFVNNRVIRRGAELYNTHRDLLAEISSEYGFPAKYIIALWAVETRYGKHKGSRNIFEPLAMLSYDDRRSAFFEKQLIHALRMLDEGHAEMEQLNGSWAGATGQVQFIPTSFYKYAEDYNGDGRRDIWSTLPDIFASAANLLSENGWQHDKRWGRRVQMPPDFPRDLIGTETKKSLDAWAERGVLKNNGRPLPTPAGFQASILQPDGPGTQAFIVYENFATLKNWNSSNKFALTVGRLADQIHNKAYQLR